MTKTKTKTKTLVSILLSISCITPIVLLRDCTAAMEYHDTLEEQLITGYVIRHVETFLGYAATSPDFVRSCERVPGRQPDIRDTQRQI
jgi:hypothetical protein